MSDLVERLLDEEEGRSSPTAYPDTRGYLTIARGVCVDKRVGGAGLPPEAIQVANKVRTDEARERAMSIPGYERCNDVRQAVLTSMCFQLGIVNWPEFRAALAMDDYEAAADAGRDSVWWRAETPRRAEREMRMLESGVWLPQ